MSNDALPASRQRAWALWLVWAGGAVLAALVALAAAHTTYFPADLYLAHRLQSADGAVVGDILRGVDKLGQAAAMAAIYAVGTLALWFSRNRSAALLLVATMPLRLSDDLVKDLVQRPRPSPDLVTVVGNASGYGFPSGHALGAVLLYGLIFCLAWDIVPGPLLRWIVQVTCLALILAVGLARVELGVHWPSDVVGGYLIGGLLLAAVLWLHRRCATIKRALRY